MSNKIKIGIIGFGGFGNFILKALTQSEHSLVTTVADPFKKAEIEIALALNNIPGLCL